MPHRPASPCKYPGCAELTHSRYCDAHVGVMLRRDPRPTAAQRGYGASWRRVREVVLMQEPYCRNCKRPASEVDHIVPLTQGGSHDISNLQSLCRSCHISKTRRESLARAR